MKSKMLEVRKGIVLCLLFLPMAVGLVGCGSSHEKEATSARAGSFSILVFSRTTDFRHVSIETGVQTVQQLGAENGFTVDHTEDPTAFTSVNLAKYAAVLWLSTTGDVLNEEQQKAFEGYISKGGGYVGVHSASDTEHDWPYYGELVGAYFASHPVWPPGLNNEGQTFGIQEAEFIREAAEHPATVHLPARWRVTDEFYSFLTNPRGKVRVLLSIDESTYNPDPNTTNIPPGPYFPGGRTGVMNDHPMSWCHDNFGGRSWYTALGHDEALYSDPAFRQHLLGGILTATRRIRADCRPREIGPLAEPNEGPSFSATSVLDY
ncbi:ThuA domain-containing protein [Perlucidibaca aquatica]|uniref:ThuA domain-containing protein n=1 Tax=Perlucidibaca aquatica TaxID=1852776 RepID=UPI0009ED5BD3|nr:ThuA domain-containing protein [Perlucidibaca aquatica]